MYRLYYVMIILSKENVEIFDSRKKLKPKYVLAQLEQTLSNKNTHRISIAISIIFNNSDNRTTTASTTTDIQDNRSYLFLPFGNMVYCSIQKTRDVLLTIINDLQKWPFFIKSCYLSKLEFSGIAVVN